MNKVIKLLRGSGWLNLFGLSIAFAAIYIIMIQVHFECSFNHNIKDADRTYIMFQTNRGFNHSRPEAARIISQSPFTDTYGFSWAGGIQGSPIHAQTEKNGKRMDYEVSFETMTSSMLDILDFRPIEGSFQNIGSEACAAISEKTAQRMQIGIGDMVFLPKKQGGIRPHRVCAIFQNLPDNQTGRQIEIIACYDMENFCIDDENEHSFMPWIRLHNETDARAFEQQANEYLKKIYTEDQDSPEVKLISLKDLYFCPYLKNSSMEHGNKAMTFLFFGVALLILLITVINYVNFVLSQVPVLLKSVNTRKILGCSRKQLILQFISQSALLVLLGLSLSFVWILLFKNSDYQHLVRCSIDISTHLGTFLTAFLAVLLTIVGATLYPAFLLTSFSPAMALKGSMNTGRGNNKFRYGLIGLQFAISMTFLICTFLLRSQYSYMMHFDMGFDKENLYSANISRKLMENPNFLTELRSQSAIKDAAWGDGNIVRTGRMSWDFEYNNQNVYFECYPVSYNFLDLMGIQIKEGRMPNATDALDSIGNYIFNEEAQKRYQLTLEDRLPTIFQETGEEANPIMGFCENFKFKPVQMLSDQPFAFFICNSFPFRNEFRLYLRSQAGATYQDMLTALQQVVSEMDPEMNPEMLDLSFFNEELNNLYRNESNTLQLISLASFFSIFISLMGVAGLLFFEMNYRKKEIGIRRVHGASIGDILQIFYRRYLNILLLSFLFAGPVSYLAIHQYYSKFALHAPIHLWIFAAAFAFLLLITVTVITLTCYRAASANPVESIRNE